MLTPGEKALCAARPTILDHERAAHLHFLGKYVRRLPVNMARMIENARDWEHLPYVHSSSFSSIDLIASGDWGWRAKIGLPQAGGGGYQLLDLIIDTSKNYWVSTVIAGPGEGIEIHTQATQISDAEIEVDVRFYLPHSPDDNDVARIMLEYLRNQYTRLYAEDQALMAGRQRALDDRSRRRYPLSGQRLAAGDPIVVGEIAALDQNRKYCVETRSGEVCVRYWSGMWVVHAAKCPHLLGPLDQGEVDDEGFVECPWHGYKFDINTGAHRGGTCSSLDMTMELQERDGALVLV